MICTSMTDLLPLLMMSGGDMSSMLSMCMMESGKVDMKTVMIMQMMQSREGTAASGQSSMLPMLIMMNDDDDSDDSMIMITMMMSQAQPKTVVVVEETGLTIAEQSREFFFNSLFYLPTVYPQQCSFDPFISVKVQLYFN